jgi:phosphoglycerate dehydrogenase-like enzyme
MAEKLRIILAATPDFRELVFTAAHQARLESLGDVGTLDDPSDPGALKAALPGADVLITSWGATPLTADVLDHADRLRLIAHSASSVKHFVTDEVFDRGIRLTQSGQAMARPVAEMSLAFTLAMLYRLPRHDHAMHAGAWRTPTPAQHELAASRIGVIGASRTGREYLGMITPLAAEVVVHDPYLTAADEAALGVRRLPLDDLLRTSRIVALHAPVVPETHHLLGARELALMPDGAGLVNTARSWLVHPDALLAELTSGRLDAALDVYDEEPLPVDHPLRALPNVLLTPHQAAATVECHEGMGEITVDQIERFAAGEPLPFELTAEILPRMG